MINLSYYYTFLFLFFKTPIGSASVTCDLNARVEVDCLPVHPDARRAQQAAI